MKTALGYIRLSRDDAKSLSVEYQRAAIERLCQEHDFKLVGLEYDNGISGSHLNRDGVQRVLQAVKGRTVDAVVVFKSDRLSRNGIESLQIEQLFQTAGIQYVSATEGILSNCSADDEFMAFVRAGLNQRERKIISLRTRYALQQKKEQGKRLGRPIRGWRVRNGVLIEDCTEQRMLEEIKALHGKGCSTRGIVRALQDRGLVRRNNKRVNQSYVSRVIRGQR